MDYYSSYRPNRAAPAPKRKSRRRGSKLFILLLVVLLIGGGAYLVLGKKKPSSSNDQTTHNKAAQTTASTLPPSNVTDLGNEINAILSTNSNIDFSVTTVDLNSGLTEHYGVNTAFDAASIGKLVTATDLLHHVEQGTTSLTQTMSDGNSEQYDLQQMIVISDDNTWATLNNYLGNDSLQDYADSIGMTNYDADDNTMTSNDVATLLQKLYKGQLLNSSDTQLLLGYMKEANYREYMLPAIPSSYTVYHKVGLDVDNVHDVAIITKGGKSIILTIFTNGNGTYEWTQRAQIMQQIATDTLKAYFTAP